MNWVHLTRSNKKDIHYLIVLRMTQDSVNDREREFTLREVFSESFVNFELQQKIDHIAIRFIKQDQHLLTEVVMTTIKIITPGKEPTRAEQRHK